MKKRALVATLATLMWSPAGSGWAVPQGSTPLYSPPAGLSDVGAASGQPFVLVCGFGQSNETGSDDGGNAHGTTVTASLASQVLTVTALSSSGLVFDGTATGLSDLAGNIPAGVHVTGQISGTTGGIGAYQTDASTSLTVASEAMATGVKTTLSGIYVTNSATAPTALVPLVPGTAPWNTGIAGPTTNPAFVNNSPCFQELIAAKTFFNALGINRDVVGVYNALGGQSITDWADGYSAPTDMVAALQSGLALVTARYGTPGSAWIINHVASWQGEQDVLGATFTGRIDNGTAGNSGSVMTVSAVASGTLSVGTVITGGALNTTITALGTGTGGTGTYTVSIAQSVPSQTLTTGSSYNTDALYKGAFQRVVARFQALPGWSATQTRWTVQELGTWGINGSAPRNGFLRTTAGGRLYPFMTFNTSAGYIPSAENAGPHAAGVSLTLAGQQWFASWLQGRIAGSYSFPVNSNGSPASFFNQIAVACGSAGSPTVFGVDDLKSGAVVNLQGGYCQLPDPTVAPSPFFAIANASSTMVGFGAHGGANIINAPVLGFSTGTGTLVMNLQDVWLMIPDNAAGYWYAILISRNVGNTLDVSPLGQALTAGQSGNYSSTFKGAIVDGNASAVSLSSVSGVGNRYTVTNAVAAAGATIVTDTKGIVGPDGQTTTTYSIPPGQVVVFETAYSTGFTIVQKVIADSAWNGHHADYFTPATGATIAATSGYGDESVAVDPAGTIAALTITLPASPKGGQHLDLAFTQAVTTVTYSGGTVATNAASAGATAGMHLMLTYNAAQVKWY